MDRRFGFVRAMHVLLSMSSMTAAAAAEFGLSPLFLNATLQHSVSTAVWGTGATPNTTVHISVVSQW